MELQKLIFVKVDFCCGNYHDEEKKDYAITNLEILSKTSINGVLLGPFNGSTNLFKKTYVTGIANREKQTRKLLYGISMPAEHKIVFGTAEKLGADFVYIHPISGHLSHSYQEEMNTEVTKNHKKNPCFLIGGIKLNNDQELDIPEINKTVADSMTNCNAIAIDINGDLELHIARLKAIKNIINNNYWGFINLENSIYNEELLALADGYIIGGNQFKLNNQQDGLFSTDKINEFTETVHQLSKKYKK